MTLLAFSGFDLRGPGEATVYEEKRSTDRKGKQKPSSIEQGLEVFPVASMNDYSIKLFKRALNKP